MSGSKLYAPSTIGGIQKKYNFHFSKNLGQNFLTDGNLVKRIVESAEIGPEDLVIEIGPGIGVLTAEAARRGALVTSVEIDSRLIPILRETLEEFENVEILHRDIMKTDLNELIRIRRERPGGGLRPVRILGNLPYYITTPILMKILEENVPAETITFMMQKEVARRIQAPPGSRDCGAISLAVRYYCRVTVAAEVSREVFYPRPRVDSAVLRLEPRKEKPVFVSDEKLFFEAIRHGFGQRRKTLENALAGWNGKSKEEIRKVLEAAGIDGRRRGETLSLEEYAKITGIAAGQKADSRSRSDGGAAAAGQQAEENGKNSKRQEKAGEYNEP